MPAVNIALDAIQGILEADRRTASYAISQRPIEDPFRREAILLTLNAADAAPFAMGVNRVTARIDLAVHTAKKDDARLLARTRDVLDAIYDGRHAQISVAQASQDISVATNGNDSVATATITAQWLENARGVVYGGAEAG